MSLDPEFGNGASWAAFDVSPPLTLDALRGLASWFVVITPQTSHKGAAAPAPVDLGNAFEDPTSSEVPFGAHPSSTGESLPLPRTSTPGLPRTATPALPRTATPGLPRTKTVSSGEGFATVDVTNPGLHGLGGRTKTGASDSGPPVPSPIGRRYVFRVKRGPLSQFDFVSLGRNPGNDLWVPDDSVSRFHAFFRETPKGLVVVDAKSANGTFVRGQRVPQQGAGDPVQINAGDPVRFGDVHGVALDAAALHALLRR